MSLLEQKKDFSKRGAFDELYTPEEAVEMILKHIPKGVKTIWECTAIKESKIVKVLKDAGYNVITSHIEDGQDFFKYEPENYDMIITNPPYSLKDKFLKRAYELKKPFMFLLPLTTLEGIERGKMFDKNGIQMLIPNKRFNFKPEKNSGAWFQTSWFCFGCGLSSDLNFVSLQLRSTFLGLAKVAIFTTNADAENQTLINHKCVCGALNRHFCQTRVI